MTVKRAGIEALFIAITVGLSILDHYFGFGLDQIGIVVVSGIFGAIPGVVAVFITSLGASLIFRESFAMSYACFSQFIVIIVSFFVRKGLLKTKRRCALLYFIVFFVRFFGLFIGNLIDNLGEKEIGYYVLTDSTALTYAAVLIIPFVYLYIFVHLIKDTDLLYLPNLYAYIKDESIGKLINEREMEYRKQSLGSRMGLLIVFVATVMTITAIVLFNTLYFRPDMLISNMRRMPIPHFGPVSGNAPGFMDPGMPPENGNPSEQPSDSLSNSPEEASDSFSITSDGMDIDIQLGEWTTKRGAAKNIAFFIKFVLGLIYIEIAEIAVAMAYVKNTVADPVEAVSYAMNIYAAGNEDERLECIKYVNTINIKTGDELETLYRSFGKMVEDFGEYVERLKKENELEKDLEVERASNAAKSAFLSNMSHELRTPINAVLGMDEMILRESDNEEIINYAADIQNAGRTLLSLVNDILDFSKIEAGKMEIIPVDYELSSLINDLVNMIRTKAESKGIAVKVQVNETMPHILHGDEIRIKQVITNILSNAVKYTEEGSITLKLDYERRGEKELDIMVSVRDTGIGIKEEDLTKLFVAFERIEEKRNRTIEGTGLGMNITQSLLNMMGSRLEVKSVYGDGSEFCFSLRQGIVKDEPIGNIEETYKKTLANKGVYRESFRAPDARILIVDDTEMNLSVIKSLLKKTLIRVDTALSGFDCLDMIKKNRYDIIFLDHRMPEMDGVETFKKMKEMDNSESKCLDVPVVALTANAISGARDYYLKEGFTDYLTKPVDFEKLEKLIKDLLPDEKTEAVVADPDDSGQSGPELPEWLIGINELNTGAGIRNCGSPEEYLKALRLFYTNIEDNYDSIKGFYDKGDRNNYNIRVHALKSSARLIGAEELSEEARLLEEASNEESYDPEYIKEKTPKLLSNYLGFLESLSPLDNSADTEDQDIKKPEIDKDSLSDAYSALEELIAVADFDSAAMIIDNVCNYSIKDTEEEERFREVKKAAGKFDWDSVLTLIRER